MQTRAENNPASWLIELRTHFLFNSNSEAVIPTANFREVYATAACRNDPTSQKFGDLVQKRQVSWLFMRSKSYALALVTEHLALRSAGYVHGVAWHVEMQDNAGKSDDN